MTKNEKFQMRLKEARYQFVEKENFVECLSSLRFAGDMALKEIKREEENKTEETNRKLL